MGVVGPSFDDVLNYPYWRHRIPLGDGRVTPGTKPPADWERLGLPDRLDGASFLDVGAFDGLHAFEAERRGASRVVATDVWGDGGTEEWWYGREPRIDGIDTVAAYLDSDVERRRVSIYDLEALGETFDVVVCAKVLPFLEDPLGALKALVAVSGELVVVESATAASIDDDLPGLELAKVTTANPNRWWHPTVSGLRECLELAGCRRTESYRVEPTVDAPEVEAATTVSRTVLHRDYELETPVDEVGRGTRVSLLYETDGAVRIEYREDPSEPYRQGWVRREDVRPGGAEAGHVVRRAAAILREDPLSLPAAGRRYLRSAFGSSTVALVHGFV